jgi:hypothetical protein
MGTAIEDLERRLAAVERELAVLRQRLDTGPPEQAPAERGARLWQQSQANQEAFAAGARQALAEMGIAAQPIGADKVQQLVAACGFRPEDNEFSRGIIAMREE